MNTAYSVKPLMDDALRLIAERNLPVYALCEVIGDRWRVERPRTAHLVNDIYSVSKSFTATAAGMAIDRGLLSLEDTVGDVLREEVAAADTDNNWGAVTLRHVLSQTTGIAHGFLDVDGEDISRWDGTDYLRITLRQPLVHSVGTVFTYSDSHFYLACRMISKAVGKPMQDFLREELFTPLGFQGWGWAVCPRGYAMGGTGLFLRVEDMAKLGVLYRDGGIYAGRRYLSEKWTKLAGRNQQPPDNGVCYGLGFWPQGKLAFEGNGMLYQIIYVSPAENRVFAWQSCDPEGVAGCLHPLLREASDRAELAFT